MPTWLLLGSAAVFIGGLLMTYIVRHPRLDDDARARRARCEKLCEELDMQIDKHFVMDRTQYVCACLDDDNITHYHKLSDEVP